MRDTVGRVLGTTHAASELASRRKGGHATAKKKAESKAACGQRGCTKRAHRAGLAFCQAHGRAYAETLRRAP
jgi:hypothetical protein